MNVKLSIITINRNNAAGLRKTIESVVSQTFTDFEYIVIDGASTDDSVEIITQYAKNFVKEWFYRVSEPDRGIYNAMNKGIRQAKGKYCLFLNSGDYFVDKYVLEKASVLNFDEDIIYGEQLVEKNGNFYKCSFLDPEHITFRSFINSTLPHQCTFIKRTLFDLAGFYNENNKIVSDWEFNMLALFKYNCSLQKINIPISVYDTNGISSNQEIIIEYKEEKRAVLYRHFPRIMKDIEAVERFEKSKLYKFCKIIKSMVR